MKISIAICTYNGEKYLREQLDSFAAQTRLPDEIVVCDDCSKDSTRKVLTDFAEQAMFPVRLHFNEANLGFIKNFEKAITLCGGDIIVLSDQDDFWEPHKLAAIEKEFARSDNIGLVYADADAVDENLQSFGKTMWECINFPRSEQRKFNDGNAFELLLTKGYVLGSSMAFRARFRDLVVPIPLDTYYIHDNWIALMVAAVSESRLIRESLVKYRHHEQQSSIGVINRSQPDSISEARRRGNSYEEVIAQLDIAENRLRNSSYDAQVIENAIAKIKPVRNHLQNRLALPKNVFRRTLTVGSELLRRRYHKYSNGLRSAIKDIATN